MIRFSVIICTYNGVSRLQKTLEHLAGIEYPPELVEIILVDNNSTDGTGDYAKGLWTDLMSPISFQVVMEKQQGLNNARKRGIYVSKYDYVVFCDDDNWLSSGFLKSANEVLAKNSSIGVLGGQGVPVTDADRFPNWFYTYCGCYAVGVQGVKSGDISERGYAWGAGAIVCRKFLESLFSDGYDLILSGRKGYSMAAGDDSEMCKWFLIAGYRLWYEENMEFYHFIPKERLTMEYLEKLFKGLNESQDVLVYYDKFREHMSIRRMWYENPLRWLRTEMAFYLDRNPYKRDVMKLVRKIHESSMVCEK